MSSLTANDLKTPVSRRHRCAVFPIPMRWQLVFTVRLHAPAGKHEGLHSVSINLSYRITMELLIRDGVIIPVNVGDHDEVY